MALIVRYVNASSTGGDGTTPATSGPNAAYASIVAWEAAERTDLVADNDIHNVRIAAGTYTGEVDFTSTNWTTDDTHYIWITADDGSEHLGVIGNGVIWTSTASGDRSLWARVKVVCEDLEIRSETATSAARCIQISAGGDGCEFHRCIIGPSLSTNQEAIFVDAPDTKWHSCVIYKSANDQGIVIDDFLKADIRNCTIVGNATVGIGIDPGGTPITDVYNTVAVDNATQDFATVRIQGDFNASGDLTAPTAGNSLTGIDTTVFISYEFDDFNLYDGSPLVDAGTSNNRAALSIQKTAWFTKDIGAYAYIPAQSPETIANGRFFPGYGIKAQTQKTEGVFYPGYGIFYKEEAPTGPGEPMEVTLGNAASIDVSTPAPTIEIPAGQIVTLGNAAEVNTSTPAPTVEAPQVLNVVLANAALVNVSTPAPTIESPQENIVTLANAAQIDTSTPDPTIESGGLQIVTLGNAAQIDTSTPIPTIIATDFQIVTLGNAAEVNVSTPAPTVEGESELPPSIQVPTEDQVLRYNQSGTIPAPPFSPGTGGNITWSLQVDEFSAQPGVTTFTISPATGDITYQIAQLSTDADVQALNTKGPYNITRRVTTSVAHDEESWQIGVNVGSYTLDFTPGTKLVTWDTQTPLARGLQTDKDLSAPVTQTYTVT